MSASTNGTLGIQVVVLEGEEAAALLEGDGDDDGDDDDGDDDDDDDGDDDDDDGNDGDDGDDDDASLRMMPTPPGETLS